MGELKHSGAVESEKKDLRLRVKRLICISLNGIRIRQSKLQPYIPWAGMLVSWKGQQLGAIPGQGLLLNAERRVEGM